MNGHPSREFSFLADEPIVTCKVCSKEIGPSEERLIGLHHDQQGIVYCASCAEKFRYEPLLYTLT